MRRLLLVSHYAPPHEGGIERVVADHAAAAAAAGWEVAWVASRVPVDALAVEAHPWGTLSRVTAWNGLEERFGVPVPVWGRRARATVRELVERCDVVHVHDVLYPGTSLALAAAKQARRPSLLTQHVGFVPYRSRVLGAIEHLAYRTIGRRNGPRASVWGYYNPVALAWLRRIAPVGRPAVELPNGVDTGLFRPPLDDAERRRLRRAHRLPATGPVVLFVGRLVPRKGAHLVAAAADPAYHLLLVGERGEVGLPPADHVELRPFVPRTELAELMRAVDIFVLPSQGEGFPLVAQEAMASGLAVVLGRDPGYAQQVSTAAVVQIEPTVEAVRATLGRLAGAPAERAALGRAARAAAVARWDLATCRGRLLDVYAALARGDDPATLGPLTGL